VDGSVTRMIEGLRRKSDSAGAEVWRRFQRRMAGLAQRKLRPGVGVKDSEDIAIEAFHSFLVRLADGRLAYVRNREDAWRTLATIVVRKAINAARDACRLRRAPAPTHELMSAPGSVDSVVDPAPTPDRQIALDDAMETLLAVLDDDQLRSIALAKLAGETNQEIAVQQKCSLATIERRLKLIRMRWEKELPE